MDRFFITCDCHQITGMLKIVEMITISGLEKKLASNNYGSSIKRLRVILFCHEFEWKPRIRFTKNDKILGIDVIVDYTAMCKASFSERKLIVGQRMMADLAQVIAKYKFEDFDLPRFLLDLEVELKSIDFLPADIVEN